MSIYKSLIQIFGGVAQQLKWEYSKLYLEKKDQGDGQAEKKLP